VLEETIRHGNNAAAKVAAIKQVRAMRDQEEMETPFDELYPD
jgi:hypothetical protein